jgi:hypothetical protein
LCYLKSADRGSAAMHLEQASGALPNRKEHAELLEFESTVLMGTAPPVAAGEGKTSPASRRPTSKKIATPAIPRRVAAVCAIRRKL